MADTLIALRHDAWSQIGLGHLRRATALARECASRGLAVRHVVPAQSRALLLAEGIDPALILDAGSDWVHPGFDAVITDINWHGNGPGASQEVSALVARGLRVVMIDCIPPDEYIDQPHPPSLILTPYLNAHALRSVPPRAPWQAGAQFTILSPDYAALRADPPPRGARVLVTCGGSDPDGFSAATVEALLDCHLPLDVVVGPLFDARTRAQLATLAAAHPHLTLHESPATLAPLIAGASLVAGRAGLIRYEAACLGTYGLYLAGGDAYAEYFRHFTARGFAEIYQEGQNGGRAAYLARLRALADPAVRAPLMQRNAAAMAAVDGNGAANVIDAVLKLLEP